MANGVNTPPVSELDTLRFTAERFEDIKTLLASGSFQGYYFEKLYNASIFVSNYLTSLTNRIEELDPTKKPEDSIQVSPAPAEVKN